MSTLRRVAAWRPPAPHLVVGALCVGLAGSLVVRIDAVALGLAAGALAAAAPLLGRRRAAALVFALAGAGLWWGSARLELLDASTLTPEIGRAGLARVEVTGPARRSPFSLRVPVRVVRWERRAVDEPARLELPPKRAPPQGSVLELVAEVRRPHGADGEGSFDETEYLRRQGVDVVLRAGSYREVGRRGGLGGVADRLRRFLDTSMAPGLEGERRALVAGVVLGEDEGLSPELREDFRASGLFHLLAVSGQNVAYVVFGALLLAWAMGLPRWAGHVGALVAVTGYVLAVGWQPSVVRAGIAGSLASLAWLAARPADRWYFLLVGAAVLLAVNPYGALEPGFQLSFAAVAAIFVAVPRLERRLEGYPLPNTLVEVTAVSVVCGVATAPILWLHFGAVPVYSILGNALAAPVVAPLLGVALSTAALGAVLPTAAAALAWGNGWLAAYLAWCARVVGGLPHAEATSLTAIGLGVALAGIGVLATRVRAPRGRRLFALAGMLVALVVAWRAWVAESGSAAPPAGLRITFLDVGQGDATLLQVPEGAVLVDQGPPEARVADQLEELGVERLALLVMTHPSRDNIGGAKEVVEQLDVELVLDPALAHENPFGRPAVAAARRQGSRVGVMRAGQLYRLGGLIIRVLWPDGPGRGSEDPNDRASVLLVSYGEVDALLPADAESNVTLPLRPPQVEVLKVGHHGSKDGGLPELLDVLRPRFAVVSVGRGNDYGHPAPGTLAALYRAPGLDVYRTDEDGRIVLESDGRRISLRTER